MFFLTQLKYLLTQNFVEPNFFWIKEFWVHKFFITNKIFLVPTFFSTNFLFQHNFFCQTPVQLESGVDFVLNLSQEEQEQPPPKSTRMKCTTDLEFGTKTSLTKFRPHPPSPGWSPAIPRLFTHHPKDSQPSNSTRSLTLEQPRLFYFFCQWTDMKSQIHSSNF